MANDLVVVTWNGEGEPFPLIQRDAEPAFELASFCYTGAPAQPSASVRLFAHKTQCKGEAFSALIADLEASRETFGYVGFIDDDVELSVSGINRMLERGHAHGHATFAAGLTADSHLSHQRFVQRPGSTMRPAAWVEVMAPFVRWELLRAAGPLIAGNTSSYGVDQFVMPMLEKVLSLPGSVIHDDVPMRHVRPITSDGRVFANGLTAEQERVAQRQRCLEYVRAHHPELVGTRWWFNWGAPWDGPAPFWALRLAQPYWAVRRAMGSKNNG